MFYRYNKISSIRSFSESPAKKFLIDGKTVVKRKDLEKKLYSLLKYWIEHGRIHAAQEIR